MGLYKDVMKADDGMDVCVIDPKTGHAIAICTGSFYDRDAKTRRDYAKYVTQGFDIRRMNRADAVAAMKAGCDAEEKSAPAPAGGGAR